MTTITQHGLKTVMDLGLSSLSRPWAERHLVAWSVTDSTRNRANAYKMEEILQVRFGWNAVFVKCDYSETDARLYRHLCIRPVENVICQALALIDSVKDGRWLDAFDYRTEMRPLIDQYWNDLTIERRLTYLEAARCGIDRVLDVECPVEIQQDLEDLAEFALA